MSECIQKPAVAWPCLSALFGLLLLVSNAPAATPSATQVECERAWKDLAGQQLQSDAMLAAWRSEESKCKGTGVYEVRLASIHTDRDEFDLARQVLQAATIPDNFKRQAEFIGISNDYLQALSTGERARLEKLEVRAETFVKASSGTTSVLGILGHTRVLLGEYEQAIAPLEAMVRSGSADVGDHRNLTIAYANAGHYQEALELLDTTFSMSQEVTSDEKFMYAATLAYAATGKVDAAKSMLTLILNKKPQLKDDPGFQQTVLKAKELSHGALK